VFCTPPPPRMYRVFKSAARTPAEEAAAEHQRQMRAIAAAEPAVAELLSSPAVAPLDDDDGYVLTAKGRRYLARLRAREAKEAAAKAAHGGDAA
jgi:hypothetical protein